IKVYPYSSIMSCEIIEDGETIYRKSNTLGRAVVGGVIAGGVGAVIGGLTAQGKQDKEIKTIDLKILIRDSEQLGFNIRFFDAWEVTSNTKQSVKLSESVYGTICKQAIKQLEEW